MSDEPLASAFSDRIQEIDEYLEFLSSLEDAVKAGPPELGGNAVTSRQQKILYSSVYLQLYNLVEATATWCIRAVTGAAVSNGTLPGELCAGLRREWVRFAARTHVDLNYENRLQSAVELCDRLIGRLPVEDWGFARANGNWDDQQIERISSRIECNLRISPSVRSAVKRKIRDDKPPLELVKYLRNRLAHGSISFAECGEGVTVDDLKELKEITKDYLGEVISQFQEYIDEYKYLDPSSRPTGDSSV